MWRGLVGVVVLLGLAGLWPSVAGAQGTPLYPAIGPGQDVPTPSAQCPQTLSCDYSERNQQQRRADGTMEGLRFQSLLSCGANCAAQYWISDIATGRVLLAVGPVRGGATIAVRRGDGPTDTYPPVRVIMPDYQAGEPMCCPSQFRDTLYTWDATRAQLVAAPPRIIPAADYNYDAVQRELTASQFGNVFR